MIVTTNKKNNRKTKTVTRPIVKFSDRANANHSHFNVTGKSKISNLVLQTNLNTKNNRKRKKIEAITKCVNIDVLQP